MPEPGVEKITASVQIEGCSETLKVVEISGREGLSRLFHFDLRLVCSSAALDLDALVGSELLLTLERPGADRYMHGIISRAAQLHSGDKLTLYRVQVSPRAWRLRHRRDCRIFQDMSARQIINKILEAAQVEVQFSCQGAGPREREYCVQYRESDWSFVERLLQEEGLFYYFEHTESGHVLQVGDHYQMHQAIAGDATVLYHPPGEGQPSEEHISELTLEQGIRSGKVSLTDYNFQRPSLDLLASMEGSDDTDLELYDHPGRHQLGEAGERFAEHQLEAQQARRTNLRGSGDCVRFMPGRTYKLDQHPRSSLNGERLLLTMVAHRATVEQVDLNTAAVDDNLAYDNSFCCAPRDITHRPIKRQEKPRVSGVQTAVVTGPSGEEIYTDEHGRVKVQFPWDREGKLDEESSCWVRVNQLWTGQAWGYQWIPRVGNEVIVDFVEGDPDRPIIVGMTYNSRNPPPYPLPDEKTKSSIKSNSSPGGDGFNEIRFEDKKGEEELYIHAERDLNMNVKRSTTGKVGKDRTITVDGKQTVTVKGGDAALNVTAGNRVVDVTGNYSATATGTATIEGKGGGVFLKGDPFIIGTATAGIGLTAPVIFLNGTSSIVVNSPNVTILHAKVAIEGSDVSIKGGNVKIEGAVRINC